MSASSVLYNACRLNLVLSQPYTSQPGERSSTTLSSVIWHWHRIVWVSCSDSHVSVPSVVHPSNFQFVWDLGRLEVRLDHMCTLPCFWKVTLARLFLVSNHFWPVGLTPSNENLQLQGRAKELTSLLIKLITTMYEAPFTRQLFQGKRDL